MDLKKLFLIFFLPLTGQMLEEERFFEVQQITYRQNRGGGVRDYHRLKERGKKLKTEIKKLEKHSGKEESSGDLLQH